MKRIVYQYQIIKFMPDPVSEEFVNIGVILYSGPERTLLSEVVSKYRRITQFFDNVNGAYLLKSLKHIDSNLKKTADQIEKEAPFTVPEKLTDITSKVLPYDDSALYLSPVKKGLDVDLGLAFEKLKRNFIVEPEEQTHNISDKDVWTRIYRPFFQEHGIAESLSQKTFKTDTDELEFELAYKNGHWNCIESANFELKWDESIKDKVFRIIGKLDALSNNSEEIEYHILANLNPAKPKMNKYIQKKLSEHQIGRASINLVTQNNVNQFIKRVKKDLQH